MHIGTHYGWLVKSSKHVLEKPKTLSSRFSSEMKIIFVRVKSIEGIF